MITPDRSDNKKALLEKWLRSRNTQKSEDTFKRNADAIPTLSFSQQRLWFLDQWEPGLGAYNIPLAVRLDGALDISSLENSIAGVVARHEILRTSFRDVEGTPSPIIETLSGPFLKIQDIDETSLIEVGTEEACRAFELSRAPLFRITLFRLSETQHVLLLVVHHIVFDDWSVGVFLKEVATLYAGETLAPLTHQYLDFADWQQRQLSGEKLAKQLDFWRRNLQAPLPVLAFPTDHVRPPRQTYEGDAHCFRLDADLSDRVLALARKSETTPFTVFLAAYDVLLFRYSGQKDVLVGTPIATRNAAVFEPLVGIFINNLVLRGRVDGDPPFADFLHSVKSQTSEAFSNPDVPFEKLVSEMQTDRDTSRSPLFQVLFIFHNSPATPEILPGLKTSRLDLGNRSSRYDLTLYVMQTSAGIEIELEYKTDLFSAQTARRIGRHYENVLRSIVENPQTKLSELALLSGDETTTLIETWNGKKTNYDDDKILHRRFETQVARTPYLPAVTFEGKTWTYEELNARANQVAHYLKRNGVCAETRVGILLDRSLEMSAALWGVLKAGGAYVPLDPSHPESRREYVMKNSEIEILLTPDVLLESLEESGENLNVPVLPGNLAYVLYTSGSTGNPKGVMISHESVCNNFSWMQEKYALDETEVVLQKTTFTFDISLWELFWPLIQGSHLVFAHPDGHKDPEYLADVIRERKVSTLVFVPSMLQPFLELLSPGDLPSIRRVLCIGEALPRHTIQLFHEKVNAELHNLYGPTEATIHVTATECPKTTPALVTIGKPMDNSEAFVLDDKMQPVPVNVIGELYLGGLALARGYLGRPDLTAEKFVPSPFASGARLYRTGDLARWTSDGDLDFLGRTDFQVKVRGFRIELGEIEAALRAAPGVVEAAVGVKDTGHDKKLIAFVVLRSGMALDSNALVEMLKTRIPEYMIPSHFKALSSLPLTMNGKLDRSRLIAEHSVLDRTQVPVIAPQSEVEKTLVGIWKEVLRLEAVSTRDNFFEIGGDSLLSIQIVSRAKRAGIRIQVKQIFENPTIKDLSKVATSFAGTVVDEATSGEVPLLPTQRFLLEPYRDGIRQFNQGLLLETTQPLKVETIHEAFEKVVKHHDGLWLRFTRTADGWKQAYAPKTSSGLIFETRNASLEVQAKFDLEKGPLVGVCVYPHGDKQRILVIAHQLVADVLSWKLLAEDLEAALSLAELPVATSSFRQWANRLVEYSSSPELEQESGYWRQAGRDSVALPCDFSEGANDFGSAKDFTVDFSEDQTRALMQDLPKRFSGRAQDLIIASLTRALSEWTKNPQQKLNLEDHGREDLFAEIDLLRTVGFFSTIFPVTLYLPSELPVEDGVRLALAQLTQLPKNGIGYGVLRSMAKSETGDALRKQKFGDVTFNFFGSLDEGGPESSSFFTVCEDDVGAMQAPQLLRDCLLDVSGEIENKRLRVAFTYSENRHRLETVNQLAESFKKTLVSLIGDVAPKVVEEESYPLSPMQQGMLFHSLLDSDQGVYVEQYSFLFKGKLDVSRMKKSWQTLTDSHPALRINIITDEMGSATQRVRPSLQVPLEHIDLRKLSEVEQEAAMTKRLHDGKNRGFDLARDPLFRVTVFTFADDRHSLLWEFHHILLDGWSIIILLQQLLPLYEHGKLSDVKANPNGYRDYIKWLKKQDRSRAETYWSQALAGLESPTLLGSGTPAHSETGYGEQVASLTGDLAARLRAFARQQRLTMNTVIQGAWALFLSRHTRSRDVVFGMTVSGRPAELPEVESIVGLCINTLPVRLPVTDEETVQSYLQNVQSKLSELPQFDYLPLFEIQKLAPQVHAPSLFDTLVVFQSYPGDTADAEAGGELELLKVETRERTNYPLTILAVPMRDGFSVKFLYDRAFFADEEIETFRSRFLHLLDGILENPTSSLGEISLIPQKRVVATELRIAPKCLHQFVEEFALSQPHHAAVQLDDEILTYGELNAKANQLANWLLRNQVTPGSRVALCMERSFDMVISILGIQKAGCAYVPIDPESPRARIETLIEDCQAQLVLRSLDGLLDGSASHSPKVDVSPRDMAYVIYTSGSTGKPKGVMVAHEGVSNYVQWMQLTYPLSPDHRVLQKTFYGFDVSVAELFTTWAAGATLVLAEAKGHKDPSYLAQLIVDKRIHTLHIVPSQLQLLLQEPKLREAPLAQVFAAGEALPPAMAKEFRECLPRTRLYNQYGPTEASIIATHWTCEGIENKIPIGLAIPNTGAIILDSYLNLVPPGVAGELYLGGIGLAWGYLGNPELTSERFIPDPHSSQLGARLYRTGDLAMQRSDGNIEYLGRLDHQVKVRGFRIELGEIENALREQPAIADVVVVTDGHGVEKTLIAYFVARQPVDAATLKTFLSERLPDYMVPTQLLEISKMPLNPSGKVDRRSLPSMTVARETRTTVQEAESDLQLVVSNLWKDVLKKETLGIDDNFFDLGGHSLRVVQVHQRLRQLGYEMPLVELFQFPTVRMLADHLERLATGAPEHGRAVRTPRRRPVRSQPNP